MNIVRGVLNPEIIIQSVTLDEEQEKLVMEDTSPKEAAKKIPSSFPGQSLFAAEFGFSDLSQEELEEANLPEENKKIMENASVRLVRGEMGSGKTLVLKAKARRLSKEHPDWKILVLTYNKELAKGIGKVLKSCKNVEVSHLHVLISSYIQKNNNFEWRKIIEQENWVKNKENSFQIIRELGVDLAVNGLEVMVTPRAISENSQGRKGAIDNCPQHNVTRSMMFWKL